MTLRDFIEKQNVTDEQAYNSHRKALFQILYMVLIIIGICIVTVITGMDRHKGIPEGISTELKCEKNLAMSRELEKRIMVLEKNVHILYIQTKYYLAEMDKLDNYRPVKPAKWD